MGESPMKRILVTGGAGFIGSHTVDLLLAQNKEVVVYDNLSSGKLSYLNLFHQNLRFVQADILDGKTLAKEMAPCDAVLHLAALPSVSESLAHPTETMKVNALGFVNVLQALREQGRAHRLVFASSAAVYGAAPTVPCSDEDPIISPLLSPYALDKLNNELYADLFSRLFAINCLGLRYFNVYGNRQDPKSMYSGVITRFKEQCIKKEKLTIFGNGEQSRDFIHVSDVARANVQALQSDVTGVLNVATGTAVSINNLIHTIENINNTALARDYQPTRPGDIFKSYGTSAKFKKALGFEPEITLTAGIKQLFEG